jgi:hypothetical protein
MKVYKLDAKGNFEDQKAWPRQKRRVFNEKLGIVRYRTPRLKIPVCDVPPAVSPEVVSPAPEVNEDIFPCGPDCSDCDGVHVFDELLFGSDGMEKQGDEVFVDYNFNDFPLFDACDGVFWGFEGYNE